MLCECACHVPRRLLPSEAHRGGGGGPTLRPARPCHRGVPGPSSAHCRENREDRCDDSNPEGAGSLDRYDTTSANCAGRRPPYCSGVRRGHGGV